MNRDGVDHSARHIAAGQAARHAAPSAHRPGSLQSRLLRLVAGAIAGLAAVLVLASCSGPSFSVAVRDVTIPAGSSGGEICYVKGTESSPVRFGSATYTAQATYESDSLFNDSVTIRVYGRTEAPQTDNPCVPASVTDIRLSDDFVLQRGEPTPIEVGGSEYGSKLAEVISHDDYWLGAEISGNYTLLEREKIFLTEGRIRVTTW